MSLKDATKKMSKSDKADFTRINLTDEPDLIAEKIIKAKTDSIEGVREWGILWILTSNSLGKCVYS